MSKQKILFVCIHNSARSVIAEALLNHLYGNEFEAESAGLEPGTLNPLAVAALQERGLDASHHQPRAVADVVQSGARFDYVVTVCDETAAERCPIFSGGTTRLHWSFKDPSKFEGTWEEKLAQTRVVCQAVESKVRDWHASLS